MALQLLQKQSEEMEIESVGDLSADSREEVLQDEIAQILEMYTQKIRLKLRIVFAQKFVRRKKGAIVANIDIKNQGDKGTLAKLFSIKGTELTPNEADEDLPPIPYSTGFVNADLEELQAKLKEKITLRQTIKQQRRIEAKKKKDGALSVPNFWN